MEDISNRHLKSTFLIKYMREKFTEVYKDCSDLFSNIYFNPFFSVNTVLVATSPFAIHYDNERVVWYC